MLEPEVMSEASQSVLPSDWLDVDALPGPDTASGLARPWADSFLGLSTSDLSIRPGAPCERLL